MLALNVALSRLLDCPNLVVGNCYCLPADSVSVNLTAFVDRAQLDWQRRNIGSQVALCKLNAVTVSDWATSCGSNPGAAVDCAGGPGSGYRFRSDGVLVVAIFSSARYGIRWLLSTSRALRERRFMD